MTILEFINRSIMFPQYFDVLGVREESKKEILLIESMWIPEQIEESMNVDKSEMPEKYS